MKKKILILIIFLIIIIVYVFFKVKSDTNNKQENDSFNDTIIKNDFKIDVIYHSENLGDIHYSIYIPNNYNSQKEYPLYITLPGYEGLYFQGAGVNLEYEDFAFEGKRLNSEMIILAPQLNDWGETSANQVIALIEHYKENYNISKVYASGYSADGKQCL